MERFHCNGKLILQPSLQERTMKVELYHTYHTPYIDIELSDEILGFINELVATRTPAEIYQSLQDSNIPGAQRTFQH